MLEALPPDLREQVEQICTIQQGGESYGDSRKEPINGCNTALLSQQVGTVLLQIPELQEPNTNMGINVIALPAFSQVSRLQGISEHQLPAYGKHSQLFLETALLESMASPRYLWAFNTF